MKVNRNGRRFGLGVLLAIVALLAVQVGPAQAAKKVPSNSVGKKQLKKGAVTKKAIKKGAVTTKAIKAAAVTANSIADGAVGTAELADGSVTTPKLANGSVTSAKLSGDVAGSFGSGLMGAAVSTPAVGANLAANADAPASGSGDAFDIPVPTAMTVTDLVGVGDLTSARVVEIRIQKNGAEAMSCEIAANADSCATDAAVDFAPGDLLGVQVFVQGGPQAIGGNDYEIGYRVTP